MPLAYCFPYTPSVHGKRCIFSMSACIIYSKQRHCQFQGGEVVAQWKEREALIHVQRWLEKDRTFHTWFYLECVCQASVVLEQIAKTIRGVDLTSLWGGCTSSSFASTKLARTYMLQPQSSFPLSCADQDTCPKLSQFGTLRLEITGVLVKRSISCAHQV
jgi:hypothetical protein